MASLHRWARSHKTTSCCKTGGAVTEYAQTFIGRTHPTRAPEETPDRHVLIMDYSSLGVSLASRSAARSSREEIEPAAGAIIQELFVRSWEERGTLLELVKDLLQPEIKSPRGHPSWSAVSLRTLWSNLAYTGQLYAPEVLRAKIWTTVPPWTRSCRREQTQRGSAQQRRCVPPRSG